MSLLDWLSRRFGKEPEERHGHVAIEHGNAQRAERERAERRIAEKEAEIRAKEQIAESLQEARVLRVESPGIERQLGYIREQIELLTSEARAAQERLESEREYERERLEVMRKAMDR